MFYNAFSSLQQVLLLVIIALGMSTLSILVAHEYVVRPTCTIPLLRSTNYCRIVRSPMPPVDGKYSFSMGVGDLYLSGFCRLPVASTTQLCVSHDTHVRQRTSILSAAIVEEFEHFSGLLVASSDSPQIVRNIRDITMAIGDLIILVRYSDLENKVAIIEGLQHIAVAGRESSHLLQAYMARLSSAITTIIAFAEHTMEIINADRSFTGIALNTFCNAISSHYTCTNPAQQSFLHTIQTIETLIRHLSDYNAATDSSLIHIEGHLEGIMDLIGGETHHVSTEIGELLGSLWTRLGGNRSRLAAITSRFQALARIGVQTKLMKKVVWDVRQELDGLHESTATLHASAAEPLFANAILPRYLIVQALVDGCYKLHRRLIVDPSRPETLLSTESESTTIFPLPTTDLTQINTSID